MTLAQDLSTALDSAPQAVFERPARSIMVGILGTRGSFKSGLASYLAAQEAAKNPNDVAVLHNGFLTFGRAITVRELMDAGEDDELWDELVGGDHIKRVILVVDEIQEWFDPIRTVSLVQYRLSHLLVQIRKRQLTIIWTSQKPNRLSSSLLDQTDYVYFPTLLVRKWQPKKFTASRYKNLMKYAPRCRKTLGHPRCAEFPENYTVNLRMVVQENASTPALPIGTTFFGKLHCAHRFLGLWKTRKIQKTSEVLEISSASIKAEKQLEAQMLSGLVINELVKAGVEWVSAGEFALQVNAKTGVIMNAIQAGFALTSWSMRKTKVQGTIRYYLKEVNVPIGEDSGAA